MCGVQRDILYKGENPETIIAVMNTTKLVVEIRPEKNSSPHGIWTHDLCDAGAALYQLS